MNLKKQIVFADVFSHLLFPQFFWQIVFFYASLAETKTHKKIQGGERKQKNVV